MNDGSEYELFVLKLQQAILNSEPASRQKNITIERDKKLKDSRGHYRQFDLYWEYELGGYLYKNVIECKDYSSKISIEKIDAFLGKIADFPDLKPIFATKLGYQSGARDKAIDKKIELLIVREEDQDKDWTDKDGTPLIKTISINLDIIPPPQIVEFKPYIDSDWFKTHTDIDLTDSSLTSALNNEIFIHDIEKGEQHPLIDIEKIIKNIPQGISEHTLTYNDCFLITKGIKLKMKKCYFKILQASPHKENIYIDFSKELIGVIEYLNRGKTRAIFTHGPSPEQDL